MLGPGGQAATYRAKSKTTSWQHSAFPEPERRRKLAMRSSITVLGGVIFRTPKGLGPKWPCQGEEHCPRPSPRQKKSTNQSLYIQNGWGWG